MHAMYFYTNYLTLIFSLIYFSCSSTKPIKKPVIDKVKPINHSIISEITKFNINISDHSQISGIEFFINDTIEYFDETPPFSWNFNTSIFPNKTLISLKVRPKALGLDTLKFISFNYQIDNSKFYPKAVNIRSVNYDKDEMIIKWNKSKDNDFLKYKLFSLKNEKVTTLKEIKNIDDTTYSIAKFDPTIKNLFQISIIDTIGLETFGNRESNQIDQKPQIIVLNPPNYKLGDYYISWSKNTDHDFKSYNIFELENLTSKGNLIDQFYDLNKNTLIISLDDLNYYQIEVEDIWGLKSRSNIVVGDFNHTLWGNSYSVLNTRRIDLSSDGLKGEIPSEIGNLKKLTHLALNSNFLSGSIPQEIGNLENLIFLDLSFNHQLGDEIPREISKLTNLKSLYLNNSDISGLLPYSLTNLKNLTHLNLSDNNLRGPLPYSIHLLNNLEYLNLSNNNLEGLIPIELYKLKNLKHLNLSQNNIKGSIDREIKNLPKLETLSISNNNLTGSIPHELFNNRNLKFINFENNQFSGTLHNELYEIPNISFLRVGGNNFEGDISKNICKLDIDFSNIEYFNIANNSFCPPYPNCIKNYVGIQENCE